MPTAQGLNAVLSDSLCCLGLGLLVAALYDGLRCLVGRGRAAVFCLDVLAFVLAAVLVFSYGASRSWAGGVRGYMLLALAAGNGAYFGALAPWTRAVEGRIKWLLSRPLALLRWLLWPAARLGFAAVQRCRRRVLAKARQKRRKQLQKNAKLLYNSN